jgi:hypothetical protein
MPLTVTTTLTSIDGRTFATADQFRKAFNPPPWPKWNTGFDNSIGSIDMATKIKLLIIRALNSVDRFLNDLARIRAAAALARLGYHDQVRQLMIPENPVAGGQ